MQDLQERSSELLQEEIRRAREKLSKFIFPCPHCQGEINDEHFGKDKRAFSYIKELGERIVEEEIITRWGIYRKTILEEMENQKIYEEFPAVQQLKDSIKKNEESIINYERAIAKLKSADYIENHARVKNLLEEKKELDNKYLKNIENLQNQNQELQKELTEKKEQIQNLVLRQKGQSKGQDFEKWFYEELQKVFNDHDKIIDVSKGQTGVGKRADFLQEVFTESEPRKIAGKIIYETKNTEKWGSDWIAKLENDMRTHHAEFGFIVATCENDKDIRPVDFRKKIYISGDNNNLFVVAKIMRELLITKHNFLETINSDGKEQRIKNLDEWINNKLPGYVSSLEEVFLDQEKEANAIINKAEKIKNLKEKIRKLIIDKITLEIKNIR